MLALLGESAISFLMMTTVLMMSSRPATARWTGVAAGTLVALFITFEDPLSGMSMNPARSFGPALLSGSVDSLWIYFAGPLAGMTLAAEVFARTSSRRAHGCAKLHHPTARWDRLPARHARDTGIRLRCSTVRVRRTRSARRARCHRDASARRNPAGACGTEPRHRTSCCRRRSSSYGDAMASRPGRSTALSCGTCPSR